MMEHCDEHKECRVRLDHLEDADKTQWKHIGDTKKCIDDIKTRVNVILGMLSITLLGIIGNLLIKTQIQ